MRTGAMKGVVLVGVSVLIALSAARSASAQVEIERMLRRVEGGVITQLDVRRARLLRLFPEATTDAQVLHALENRHLILARVSLFPPAEPEAPAVSAHRAAWIGRVGAGAGLPSLLARAGMSDAALEAWLRDDLRIAAYIELRFGAMPEADRAAAIDTWISDMRQRAGLR